MGRDLANAETKLSQAENDKKVKDDQIGQLREEIAHQEELISKLNREKKNIGESKLKEEEQVGDANLYFCCILMSSRVAN